FWNAKVINFSFWAINIGLMLMVVLDLFPAGSIQFKAVVERGLWYARSTDFIDYGVFNSLTWLRGIGATVFFFGGVIPLTWFIVKSIGKLKDPASSVEEMDNYVPAQIKTNREEKEEEMEEVL
ncbi:MAG: nitric-oxide reductase, partial [Bacteroidia bacterium]|nr:nitric-oxide reductase [Bacteroidia bacterium]